MLTVASDPKQLGARIGMTAMLKNLGSTMTHHPHVHTIVPSGGLAPDGSRWISSRLAFPASGARARQAIFRWLIDFDESGVTFRYKDYRREDTDRQQVITLAAPTVLVVSAISYP